jgi:hypothetical protein
MLSVEDWAEIRRLHFAEGIGVKTISKRLGVARNTVRAAVRSTDPPAYRRARRSSVVDPFEAEIHKLLKGCPTMPATVIAERVGWERGIAVLKERVAELRRCSFSPSPSSGPTIVPASSPSGICGSRRPISMSATVTRPASR